MSGISDRTPRAHSRIAATKTVKRGLRVWHAFGSYDKPTEPHSREMRLISMNFSEKPLSCIAKKLEVTL
jgi:hypothetical protein